jgi:hypothetical protein
MPDGVGNDKTTGDHMYDHPRGFQGQGDPGFAQREYRNPGSILIIGAHEMPGGSRPDTFNGVQWNCSSSVEPLRACVDASASMVVVTRSKYPVPTSR